jgi:hypothetical protein
MQVIKISDKFSIYWRSIFIIFTISIVFSLQSCNVNKHGAATPDRVIEQYLTALENRDENLMLRLAPENQTVTKEVKSKIDRIGGHKIQDSQISYTKSKPSLWNARIHGFFVDRFGKRQDFDDSIAIEYQSKGQVKLYGGRWYLLLGKHYF